VQKGRKFLQCAAEYAVPVRFVSVNLGFQECNPQKV
jgi:hypothetical protein